MANESVKLIPREIREASFPTARFLLEEEQARYEEAYKSFSGKAADSLRIGRNGSTLFKVLFLNQIGIRTASLGELEFSLENGLDLQGHYEDAPVVVLRSASDSYEPNNYLANSLAKNLEIKKFKAPLVVSGLEVVADNESQYGLSFKKTDKTEVFEAPDLSHKNNQRRFSRVNPDYSVEFNDKASRTLYTRDNGLSGLCLGRGLGLGSRVERLEDSDSYGRVVVIDSAEGTQKNIQKYISQLQKAKSEIEDYNQRVVNEAISKLKR